MDLFTIVKSCLFTFVNMENTPSLKLLLNNYNSFKNKNLFGRYITFQDIFPELQNLPSQFYVEKLGESFLKCPIHSCTFGHGPVKVLAWSQMHGNESTTTKAVFDLFNLFRKKEPQLNIDSLLDHFCIKIIPMLNPDGAVRYTRENVNGADLNRDAQTLKEVESQILRTCLNDFQPDFCFNLHDQRSIYSAGKFANPATLSFLAPAVDEDRTTNSVRKKAMQIIAAVNEDMQELLPGQIGRYDDSFNLNCTGDTIQKGGIPTILFEAGHFQNDYYREESRKFTLISIFSALTNIHSKNYLQFSETDYFRIPQNEKLFCDVLLRNVIINNSIVQVAIQFEEKIKSGKISFEPFVLEKGVDLKLFGHKEIDCKGEELSEIADEDIAKKHFPDYIVLKNIKRSIKNG